MKQTILNKWSSLQRNLPRYCDTHEDFRFFTNHTNIIPTSPIVAAVVLYFFGIDTAWLDPPSTKTKAHISIHGWALAEGAIRGRLPVLQPDEGPQGSAEVQGVPEGPGRLLGWRGPLVLHHGCRSLSCSCLLCFFFSFSLHSFQSFVSHTYWWALEYC